MLITSDTSLRNRILQIAGPAMLEMIMYMIIGIVDIAVVGRLGAVPLASVSLGSEIFFDIILAVSALGVGAGVMVAQAKGAGNLESANQVAGHTYLVGILLGLITGLLGYLLAEPIVGIFPVEGAVHDLTVVYLRITFAVAPLALTLHMCNPVFRGLGRTDIPMKIAMITNGLNIIGCFLLVYGIGFFPRLGVAGSALATSIAYVIGFAIMTGLLLGGRGGIRMARPRRTRSSRFHLRELFRLGMPSLAEDSLRMGAGLVSSFLLTGLGTLAFASHNVALSVESLSFMPGYGIAMAATALVGQAVGAGYGRGARRAARGSLELAGLMMGGLGLVFALFPEVIAAVFTNDPGIIHLAGVCIRISSLEQVTMALDMVLGGTLRGTGNTRTPMYITLFFTWCFRLPFMFLMTRVWVLSIAYIWGLFAVDWLLRGLVYVVIFRKDNWLPASVPH